MRIFQIHHGRGIQSSDSHLQRGFILHQLRQVTADCLVNLPVFVGVVNPAHIQRIPVPLHNVIKFGNMHHIITVYKGELIINFRYRKRDGPTYICHHIGRITEGDETVFVGSRHAGDCGPALKILKRHFGKTGKAAGDKLHPSVPDIFPVNSVHKAGINCQPPSHVGQKLRKIFFRGIVDGIRQVLPFSKLRKDTSRLPGSAAEAVPVLYHSSCPGRRNQSVRILYFP